VHWFNIALIGWIILIIAIAIAAYLLGAPPVWIGVGVLALIGLAVISAVGRSNTERR
jgi:hypothetical protein